MNPNAGTVSDTDRNAAECIATGDDSQALVWATLAVADHLAELVQELRGLRQDLDTQLGDIGQLVGR